MPTDPKDGLEAGLIPWPILLLVAALLLLVLALIGWPMLR